MILVDSSVWVLVGTRAAALEDYVPVKEIATCPPIVQEILQGSRTMDRYRASLRVFRGLHIFDAPMPLERYEQAAELYLRCRATAFTIRKSVDCLIAACAIAHKLQLFHYDRDFEYIARVSELQTMSLFTRS